MLTWLLAFPMLVQGLCSATILRVKLIAKLQSHYMNVLVKIDLALSLALKVVSEHGPCIVQH